METQNKLLSIFESEISKRVTILKYSGWTYFGTAISLVLITFYFVSPKREEEWMMACFVLSLLGSVGVAILATLCVIYQRQKKIEGLDVSFRSWDREGFRRWQKKKVLESIKFRGAEEKTITKAYVAYIHHIETKINGIVAFVKPALILSFVLPLYTITIKIVLESAETINIYMLYLLLIGIVLVPMMIMTLSFFKDVFSLFDSRKATYEELLDILEELKFEHETRSNKAEG